MLRTKSWVSPTRDPRGRGLRLASDINLTHYMAMLIIDTLRADENYVQWACDEAASRVSISRRIELGILLFFSPIIIHVLYS